MYAMLDEVGHGVYRKLERKTMLEEGSDERRGIKLSCFRACWKAE